MTDRERFEQKKAEFLAKINAKADWNYGVPKPTAESLDAGTRDFHRRMAAHAERKGDTQTAARARRAATA